MDSSQQGPIVYRTGVGRVRVCARCGRAEQDCVCRTANTGSPARQYPDDGFVRLLRDRKGRGGKTVTLVANLPDDGTLLLELAQTLKKLCGSGGTVREGAIEVQGEHRDRIEAKLKELGYRVKRVGG
jgi:translation initiation factor 1